MGLGRWVGATAGAAIALVAASMLLVAVSNSPAVELINLRFPHYGREQQAVHHAKDSVRSAIKQNLDKAAQQQEGALYAHALQRAGFTFDAKTKKAIVNDVQQKRKHASSLAIDPKLQTQVAVADTIKARSAAQKAKSVSRPTPRFEEHMVVRKAKSPGNSESDRVRLAEAILSKTKSPAKETAKPAAATKTAKADIKTGMKAMLDHKANMDLKRMEFSGSQHQEKAFTSQLAGNPMAAEMMKKLNAKASKEKAALYKKDRMKALSSQDLSTTEWDHSHDVDEINVGLSSKTKPDLSFGSGNDGTQLNIVDSPKMSRIQLEKALRNQLDGKAGAIGANDYRAKLANLQGGDGNPRTSLRTSDAHWNAAVDDSLGESAAPKTVVGGEGWNVTPDQFVRKPMPKVEARLRDQLNAQDFEAAEEMYHKSLVSDKFHIHTPKHISE